MYFINIIKSIGYETMKQVQGDRKKAFARGSVYNTYNFSR